jgi:hypothetical protein
VIRLRDFFGAISDRLVVDGGDLARRLWSALLWPFQRIIWGFQSWVIWPIQDRQFRRIFVAGGAVAAFAGAAALGVLALSSGGSEVSTSTPVAAGTAPLARVAPPLSNHPAAPTLQGASPVFEPARKERNGTAELAERNGSESGAAEAADASTSSAATDKISSQPEAEASSTSSPPTPAGPEAVAVAQKFADAFVVYETGGVEANVRETFGQTATRQLSRALLRRPPRLPANVEVPEAKVVNVVAAPSRGPVYPVSVSLLRLGVTSELRLSMEQTNDEWRVSDVLG